MLATQAIIQAFPQSVRSDAALVLSLLNPTAMLDVHHAFGVSLDGEPLSLPYRVTCDPADLPPLPALTDLHQTIWMCLLTRHHDGHIREAALRRIILAPHRWVAPFVVQLCGEYVVEILAVIDDHVDRLPRPLYAAYLQENAAYWATTKQRIVSYWNAYYRWRNPAFSSYVGARLITFFDTSRP